MILSVNVSHGRTVIPGQVWQSNDPRRLRAVRVVSIMALGRDMVDVIVENIVTMKRSVIGAGSFTVGPRGWSLMKEVKWRF